MSSYGTTRRLRRLEGPGGRMFLFAADHGLPAGPLPGIEDPRQFLAALANPPVTGIILNPGLARFLPEDARLSLIVHLSAGTLLGSRPTCKVMASSVTRALGLGADAVSAQIHFGDPAEDRMLSEAGSLVDEAGRSGLPVLLMAYPPGPTDGIADVAATCHAARAAAELGADLVQVPHPGSVEGIRSIVRGCPVPLLTAGGPRTSEPDVFLEAVRAALEAGAAGVSVGRHLFQHPDPAGFAHDLGDVVFGRTPVIPVRSA